MNVTKINNHYLICSYNLAGNSSAVLPWAWHALRQNTFSN
jgi:hypothetical protein